MLDPDQDEWVDPFLTIVRQEINHVDRETRNRQRLERLRPLFAGSIQLERVCKSTGNSFVESGFRRYTYISSNDDDHYQVDDLKFTINICGSFIKKLYADFANSEVMPLIKSKCTALKELSLCFEQIRNEDFTNSFVNMPNLEELKINWGCTTAFLPPALVNSIQMVAGRLKHFDLGGCRIEMVLPNSVTSIIHGLTILENLKIGRFDMEQPIIQSISKLQNLVTLHLCFLEPTDHQLLNPYDIDMEVIGTLKNLENLYLNYDYGVTDNFLIILSNNSKNLLSLSIVASHITNRGMIALNNLRELTMLDLGLYKPGFGNFGNSHITDESIGFLTNPLLFDLNLNRCKNITNNSVMKLIGNLPNLTILTVENTLVNHELTLKIRNFLKVRRSIKLHVSFKDIYQNFWELQELLMVRIVSDACHTPPRIVRSSDESESEDNDDNNDNDAQQDAEE